MEPNPQLFVYSAMRQSSVCSGMSSSAGPFCSKASHHFDIDNSAASELSVWTRVDLLLVRQTPSHIRGHCELVEKLWSFH